MKVYLLLTALVLGSVVKGHKTWDGKTATIVSVEYYPTRGSNSTLINAENFVNVLNNIPDTKIDMAIFPESVLSGLPIILSVGDNPCSDTDYADPMTILSCAAKNLTSYIVVNLDEKAECADNNTCPQKGYYLYNTDVIFDRNGTIAARYRKYNLFGEYSKDQPETPDEVIIETDFGVKFGIFTCFDLLFKSPAQDLITDKGIEAALFPTMWFSELPFLTAVQAQQMWSHTHNIPLLSAGANNPARGSGGTGIYNGAEAVVLDEIVSEGGTSPLVFKVQNGVIQASERPRDNDVDTLSKEMDGFALITDDSILDLTSKILNTSNPTVSEQVCAENTKFCCDFNIKLSKGAEEVPSEQLQYTYHLVAYSGIRSFTGVYNGGIDICGVIACLNSSLSGCGLRFKNFSQVAWPVTFNEIAIAATFENVDSKMQYPNSLLSSIRPIDPTEVIWSSTVSADNRTIERTLSTKSDQNRVLTFAIYGRDFEKDSPPTDKNDESGNNRSHSTNVAMLLVFSCVILLFKF